jgi:hypothetical protein
MMSPEGRCFILHNPSFILCLRHGHPSHVLLVKLRRKLPHKVAHGVTPIGLFRPALEIADAIVHVRDDLISPAHAFHRDVQDEIAEALPVPERSAKPCHQLFAVRGFQQNVSGIQFDHCLNSIVRGMATRKTHHVRSSLLDSNAVPR